MGLSVDIFCWLSETFIWRRAFDIEKLLSWNVLKIFDMVRYKFFCLDFSVVWTSELPNVCLGFFWLVLAKILSFFVFSFQICKVLWLCRKTRLKMLTLYWWEILRRKTIKIFWQKLLLQRLRIIKVLQRFLFKNFGRTFAFLTQENLTIVWKMWIFSKINFYIWTRPI